MVLKKLTKYGLLSGLAAILGAAPGLTQNVQDATVGPPALEKFDLPGKPVVPERTGPADQEAAPVPAEKTPASVPQAAAPAPVRLEPTRPALTRAPVAAAPAPVAERRDQPGRRPNVLPAETAPAPQPQIQMPLPATDAPIADAMPASPNLPLSAEGQDGWPIWPLAGGMLALAVAGYAFSRRRQAAVPAMAASPSASASLRNSDVQPAPVGPRPLAPAAAIPPPRPATPRAEIALAFEPTSTVVGDKDAIIHFMLTVHNAGTVPAKNVRLEARVFNAGMKVDTDIGAFFAAPLQRRVVTLPEPLPQDGMFGIQGEVPISIADIQPIEIEGRRLFIPIVAVTAVYEWEGGSAGQTSKSFMVGVAASGAGKMGPFRLDLGPRVYRSVGQRPHRLSHLA